MNSQQTNLNFEEAQALLGLSSEAGDEEIRRAYLQKVRDFPPDKEPEAFERIRDAYEFLKDPRHRARQALMSSNPSLPMSDLLVGLPPVRRFAGPKLWLDALKERMKEARS